jgi:dCTP deaminase
MTKPDPDTANLFAEHGQGTCILIGEDITTMCQNQRLIVDGFDPGSLQTTSYDFRIGAKAIVGGSGNEIDLKKDRLVIEPGSYAGIISLEKVKLPNNVFAQIGSKRKFSYDGLILLTGSIIDPGYEGHLLFGLYNASTKKVVLPIRTKICNVVFTRLPKDVKPVSADPYLLEGNFPPDFLTKMANVEVLPWNKISEEVRRIQELSQAVIDLKIQYNDVLKPIQDLTKNVDKVSLDVGLLAESVKSLRSVVGDHEKELRDVGTKVGRYGLLVNIAWGIVLIVISISLTLLFTRVLFPDRSPARTASPAQTK